MTSITGPETCNTYNMLKLSRRLWLAEPSVAVADFIERALYNHILSSQDPGHGGFVYFTSMRPGHYRTYSSDTRTSGAAPIRGWKATPSTGSSSTPTRADRLWVDLLIPSELDWAEQGVKLRLDTRFPEDGKATLTFRDGTAAGARDRDSLPGLAQARAHAADGQRIAPSSVEPGPAPMRWSSAHGGRAMDRGGVAADRAHRDAARAADEWIAVLWGPVVLAGELGTAGLEGLDFSGTHNYVATEALPFEEAPVFVGTAKDVLARVKPVEGRPLAFRTEGLVKPSDVSLAPFYRVHRQRYAVYWKLVDVGAPAAQGPD